MNKVGILNIGPVTENQIIHDASLGAFVLSNVPLQLPQDVNGPKVTNVNTVLERPYNPTMELNKAQLLTLINKTDRVLILNVDPKFVGQVLHDFYERELIHNQPLIKIFYQRRIHDPISPRTSTVLQTEPDVPVATFKSPSGASLFPYQQQMADFIIKHKRVGLFVDMGLGKTFSTLAAINHLVETKQLDSTKPILIVAPKMVALDTWSREADKWGYDMDVLINIDKTAKKRVELFEQLTTEFDKTTLLTTNPEQIKPLNKFLRDNYLQSPFQMIVVDELSQYKNGQTDRFAQLSKLSKYCEFFARLTGTPSPNSMLDVWSQLVLIDPYNYQVFGNYNQYRSKYFAPDKIDRRTRTVYSWALKKRSKKAIEDLMKPTVISLLSDGLVDLPDITYTNMYVKLPKKAQKLYDKLDKDVRKLLLEQQNKPVREQKQIELEEEEMSIANPATLTSKLAQLTAGGYYDNITIGLDDSTVDAFDKVNEKVEDQITIDGQHYRYLHDAKLKALKDIIDNSTSPVLVFFQYKFELELFKKYIDYTYLDTKSDDASNIIKQWNEGKIPVLVAHPAAAGHGLNLQDGRHTMVWYTTTWSNEQYRQAVKRLHRRRQQHSVSVIHLVAERTVDEVVVDRLNEKEARQASLMQALLAKSNK